MFFPEVFTAVGEAVNSEEQKQQQQLDHVLQFALVDLGCRAESSGHSLRAAPGTACPPSPGVVVCPVGILTGFLARQICSQKLSFLGSITLLS